ncbi:MAG: hypothetical protein ABI212_07605, partial [Burkholderiaceae bacterium]
MHADARWRPHWRLLGAVVLTSLGMAACATTDGPVSGGSQPVPKGTTTVTIAHINDTHGRYLPVLVAPGNATAQTGDPGR